MILSRSKEVLILALVITLTISVKSQAKTSIIEPQTETQTTDVTPSMEAETTDNTIITSNTSAESEEKQEAVEPLIIPATETIVPVNNDTNTEEKDAIPVQEDGKNEGEKVNSGYYGKIESEIAKSDTEALSIIPKTEIKERLTLLGLVLFLTATLSAFGFAVLIFSSVYYRAYLKQNKSAPFEAPEFLKLFFPKPINYEYEINNLCSKYLDN